MKTYKSLMEKIIPSINTVGQKKGKFSFAVVNENFKRLLIPTLKKEMLKVYKNIEDTIKEKEKNRFNDFITSSKSFNVFIEEIEEHLKSEIGEIMFKIKKQL